MPVALVLDRLGLRLRYYLNSGSYNSVSYATLVESDSENNTVVLSG